MLYFLRQWNVFSFVIFLMTLRVYTVFPATLKCNHGALARRYALSYLERFLEKTEVVREQYSHRGLEDHQDNCSGLRRCERQMPGEGMSLLGDRLAVSMARCVT